MTNACVLIPKVSKRENGEVKERDSKLFKAIKETVKDYDSAWTMWGYTQTTSFKNKYGSKVDYDEFGEVTFPSLIKVLDLENLYDEQKTLNAVARDKGVLNKVFKDPKEAIIKATEINKSEKRFVATISKNDKGYIITVNSRKGPSLTEAFDQTYNNTLNREMIGLLNSLGFDVSFVGNEKYNGLFDPRNAKLANGLFQVIKISKGHENDSTLTEEFSHLMIEGLIKHPLVQRLLNSLTSEQVQEILGDQYDEYSKEYEGDPYTLKKEAAGKLLSQHITAKGTISTSTMQEKRPLLQRIWTWIKQLFSKVTPNQINAIKSSAYEQAAKIYDEIVTGEAIPYFEKVNVLQGERLYQLQERFDQLEKIARYGKTLTAKTIDLNRKQKPSKEKKQTNEDLLKSQKRTNESIENERFVDATIEALSTIRDRLVSYSSRINTLQKTIQESDVPELKQLNAIGLLKAEAKTYIEGVQDYVNTIIHLKNPENAALLGLENEPETVQQLTNLADAANSFIACLNDTFASIDLNVLYNAFRPIFGSDRQKGIGNKRNDVMALDLIISQVEKDINIYDRYLSAMADSSDAFLTLLDKLVKDKKYERDLEMMEWRREIAKADQDLKNAGSSSDFMYELDKDGKPRRLLSPYDFNSYYEDEKKQKEKLRALYTSKDPKTGKEIFNKEGYKKALERWKTKKGPSGKPRLIKLFVDPDIQKKYEEDGDDDKVAVYEMVPNPELYNKNKDVIERLSPAQKAYYNKMMEIKRKMMTRMPHIGQSIYKPIYISEDFIESVFNSHVDNPAKAVLEQAKKRVSGRPDDIGFGGNLDYKKDIVQIIKDNSTSPKEAASKIISWLGDTMDENIVSTYNEKSIERIIKANSEKTPEAIFDEINSYLVNEDYYVEDTDFVGHKIQRVPIYYTRRLHDMNRLTRDFSGAMTAYTAMAINYEKMSEICGIAELARSYAPNRKYAETVGNATLHSKWKVLGENFRAMVEKKLGDVKAIGRINDYIDSAIYEERKDRGTTFDVGSFTVDSSKLLDTIKDYTGLLGLGFNLFSSVSNVAVGAIQQWIEVAAREHFTMKDYTKGLGQYHANIMGVLGEMGNPIKKNKLSLLIEMFDPMGEYFDSLRNANYNKKIVSEILGDGALAYIGMNAGEHYLHCTTMLAMLNHIKLFKENENGSRETVSLYDALEVKEDNGIYRLQLKDDYFYERDKIDNSKKGANVNYGKPVRDEHGNIVKEKVMVPKSMSSNDTQRYLIRIKGRIRKVNNKLNGAFGADDKGAIHRTAVGRLVMQFRQWMPAHYERRFESGHYDADLEQWVEGFYRTTGRVLSQIAKDVFKGKFKFLKYKDQLGEHEKANLRRAFAEIAMFWTFFWLIKLGGRVKDKDRNWLEKMALYQIRRMKLEVGASMPGTDFFGNIIQMLQSPTASISFFEKIQRVLEMNHAFDEIQTGRYQGWSRLGRNAFELTPLLPQAFKTYVFDESMFSMYGDE